MGAYVRPNIDIAMFRALFPNAMGWEELAKSQGGLHVIPFKGYHLILQAAELEFSNYEPMARLLAMIEDQSGYFEGSPLVWDRAVHDMIMHTYHSEQVRVVELLKMFAQEHLMHRNVVTNLIEEGWVARMTSFEMIAPFPSMRKFLRWPIIKWFILNGTVQFWARQLFNMKSMQRVVAAYIKAMKSR